MMYYCGEHHECLKSCSASSSHVSEDIYGGGMDNENRWRATTCLFEQLMS
ncbi:hypothetical protein BDA96_05G000600 [Sorghum bicolor]|uniref:Uncharacterized protein n=1 Tax=Sorghum bicolor TaxID=4558 RepID=A0A921UF78_SORBI|nr:hypothetical protein BDA96_05G000600 [Sorghum bicolor]